MGYEAARFIDKVDEEFHCCICVMILKNPMQSPCEHLSCNECITGWLAVDKSCPIERGPLQLEDLKPAPRTIRNLMNKLEIKCDFESKGCGVIVKLKNLEHHVGRCEYNPNAKVICDKGCDIEMRRHQYEKNNCFRHLAEQAVCQQEKIKNLADQVSFQNEKIEKQNDEVISLREQLVWLREEVVSLRDETRRQQEDFVNQMIRQNDKIAMLHDQVQNQSSEVQRLNDELNLRGDTISRLNDDLNQLQVKESSKLSNEMSNVTKVSVNERSEFRVWDNMKISIKQQNVLEVYTGWGYAQSVYSLEQTKFSFKVEILSLGTYIEIAIAPMWPSDRKSSIISSCSNGRLYITGKYTNPLEKWKAGDIIECGINFPNDFVNDGRRVQVYCKKNGELIRENLVAMPMDKLFPTVHMYEGSIIRYISN